MIYKKFHISCDPKPHHNRSCDWDYVHEDYDGPEDNRHGSLPSEQACREAIDDYYREMVADWETETVKHFGIDMPKVNPGSFAPCCEHGRTTFCVCGGSYRCPVHGGGCFGQYSHE